MNPVFLDTVGILALLERSDQWHDAATRVWTELNRANRPLRTTPLVLLECGNAAARKPYRRRIAEIRREFRDDGTLIVPHRAGHRRRLDRLRTGRVRRSRDRGSHLLRP